MPEFIRKTFADRRKVLQKGIGAQGLRRRGLRTLPKPKGELLHKNANAIPLEPGQKRFYLNNVQWITKERLMGTGGYGQIFSGRLKFAGKASSGRCVIKKFILPVSPASHPWIRDIVDSLDKSKAAHPKMAVLYKGNTRYLIMEPFLSKNQSKFSGNRFRISGKFSLSSPANQELFRQVAEQSAHLAKSGLTFEISEDRLSNQMIDVFDYIELKGGKPKVFVQDIDTLMLLPREEDCWSHSKEMLLHVLTPVNGLTAGRILAEVGKKFGFE